MVADLTLVLEINELQNPQNLLFAYLLLRVYIVKKLLLLSLRFRRLAADAIDKALHKRKKNRVVPIVLRCLLRCLFLRGTGSLLDNLLLEILSK